MEDEISRFFSRMPASLPLYLDFSEKLNRRFPDVKIRIQKTQITFSNRHGFAYVWLPIRKMKHRPDVYLIVSFGLPHRLDSPRIVEAVEPYPNRWMHHVLIQDEREIDAELMSWMEEAYAFADTL